MQRCGWGQLILSLNSRPSLTVTMKPVSLIFAHEWLAALCFWQHFYVFWSLPCAGLYDAAPRKGCHRRYFQFCGFTRTTKLVRTQIPQIPMLVLFVLHYAGLRSVFPRSKLMSSTFVDIGWRRCRSSCSRVCYCTWVGGEFRREEKKGARSLHK